MTALLMRQPRLMGFQAWMQTGDEAPKATSPSTPRRQWTGRDLKEQWDFVRKYGVPDRLGADNQPIGDDDGSA